MRQKKDHVGKNKAVQALCAKKMVKGGRPFLTLGDRNKHLRATRPEKTTDIPEVISIRLWPLSKVRARGKKKKRGGGLFTHFFRLLERSKLRRKDAWETPKK